MIAETSPFGILETTFTAGMHDVHLPEFALRPVYRAALAKPASGAWSDEPAEHPDAVDSLELVAAGILELERPADEQVADR